MDRTWMAALCMLLSCVVAVPVVPMGRKTLNEVRPRPQQFCGEKLIEQFTMVCTQQRMTSWNGRFRRQVSHTTPPMPPSYHGIADECCKNPCYLTDIIKYCPTDSDYRFIDPFPEKPTTPPGRLSEMYANEVRTDETNIDGGHSQMHAITTNPTKFMKKSRKIRRPTQMQLPLFVRCINRSYGRYLQRHKRTRPINTELRRRGKGIIVVTEPPRHCNNCGSPNYPI